MKHKIRKIIFNAESVAHMKGHEREILPATDLIREMVDILESCGKLDEIKFKPFDGVEPA